MPSLDKSSLRRKILQQRQSLSYTEWQKKSEQICDRLKSKTIFKEVQTILAYFGFRQEAELNSLFKLNKNWAFPRCVGKSLVWHLWQPGEDLQLGKYGIKEPLTTSPVIYPTAADLILVPMVAGDRHGYRLGYGGGYYDRLLSSTASNVPTIGIVFDFAYVEQLPVDSWDIRLNHICTESRFEAF